jgi:tol-pal system protein YbgF
MRITALFLSASLALGAALSAPAQSRDETLADIRQELSVLFVEIQRLKRELSTTGGAQVGVAGGSALQRLDAMEQELQRLTSRTEELEHRVEQVVADGTRRIGDLEFRLVELEGGDVSKLGETTTLGGSVKNGPIVAAPQSPAPDTENGAELAVGERADFDEARQALQEGRNDEAAQRFSSFNETYPGSPLSGEANFLRGEALAADGETAQAARAYLESFSGNPDGKHAPAALLKLGLALDQLGQRREACVTLTEVGTRFPDRPERQQADAAMRSIGCN